MLSLLFGFIIGVVIGKIGVSGLIAVVKKNLGK
jgi:hypothetical protein